MLRSRTGTGELHHNQPLRPPIPTNLAVIDHSRRHPNHHRRLHIHLAANCVSSRSPGFQQQCSGRRFRFRWRCQCRNADSSTATDDAKPDTDYDKPTPDADADCDENKFRASSPLATAAAKERAEIHYPGVGYCDNDLGALPARAGFIWRRCYGYAG